MFCCDELRNFCDGSTGRAASVMSAVPGEADSSAMNCTGQSDRPAGTRGVTSRTPAGSPCATSSSSPRNVLPWPCDKFTLIVHRSPRGTAMPLVRTHSIQSNAVLARYVWTEFCTGSTSMR